MTSKKEPAMILPVPRSPAYRAYSGGPDAGTMAAITRQLLRVTRTAWREPHQEIPMWQRLSRADSPTIVAYPHFATDLRDEHRRSRRPDERRKRAYEIA